MGRAEPPMTGQVVSQVVSQVVIQVVRGRRRRERRCGGWDSGEGSGRSDGVVVERGSRQILAQSWINGKSHRSKLGSG